LNYYISTAARILKYGKYHAHNKVTLDLKTYNKYLRIFAKYPTCVIFMNGHSCRDLKLRVLDLWKFRQLLKAKLYEKSHVKRLATGERP